MAVRTRYKVEATISSNTCEDKDLGDIKCEMMTDSFGEGGTVKTLLAVGATNVQIQPSGIALSKMIMIKANAKDPNATPGTVNIRLNSPTGEIIPITPMTSAKVGHMLLTTTGLSAIYASNVAAVDMELTLVCGGD